MKQEGEGERARRRSRRVVLALLWAEALLVLVALGSALLGGSGRWETVAVAMVAATLGVMALFRRGRLVRQRLQEALEAEARARRSAEESAALLDTLFNAAPVGLSVLDQDLRYVRINRAMAEINGAPVAAHIGRRVQDILPKLADTVAAAYRAAMDGNCTVITEVTGETPAAPGVRRDWLVSYYPVRAGDRLLGSGAVVLDVTDRKRAYLAAQEAVRLRDDFISVASHELKTPLTALRLQVDGYLRLVAREGALTRERMVKLGNDLDQSVGRLDKLVDSLLDFSRLASGRMDLRLELMDWAALVEEVADRFAPHLEEARCPLTLRVTPSLVGGWDRLRLEQITTNLLTNAIKYGAGAPIEVTLDGDAERAVLRVRDNGIGIKAEDQARIFHRFERAVSSRRYGGFGLGLWIVRRVADALGGTIAVESAPGAGATFTVSLPRQQAVAEARRDGADAA
jgi:PAS domain S-box-containing protein